MPNGDFEYYTNCPNSISTGDLNYAAPWFKVYASTDYFNTCDVSTNSQGVPANLGIPSNYYGSQAARSGSAYAGFYGSIQTPQNYREYLEVLLTDTLVQNEKYLVSFYVSLSDRCGYGMTTVGAYFSPTPVSSTNYGVLPYSPQILNPSSNFLSDKINWTLIEDTLTAQGGEQYITIGNFKDDLNSGIIYITGSFGYSEVYLYVDDVSVINVNSIGIKKNKSKQVGINVYPNPNPGVFHLSRSPDIIESYRAELYNFAGEIILKSNIAFSNGHAEMKMDVDNGMYLLKIFDEKGVVLSTSKVIVNK